VRRASRAGSSLRIVARDVAALQILIACVPAASCVVALAYGELYSALGFAIAAAVTVAVAYAVYRACRGAGDARGYHAMLFAGAGWLVTAAFGALPFVVIAYLTPDDVARSFVPAGESYAPSLSVFRDPLHALFESMSCYTTTSLTMAVHEPSIGHGLLFYRSLATWVGGAGMIVLSLAIIPRPGAMGGVDVYQSETAAAKVRPSVLETARAIWKSYAAITAAVAVVLFAAMMVFRGDRGLGTSAFDAINHALAAMATGGVSTLDNGVAEFGSYPIEIAHVVAMLAGTLSLPLLYVSLRERSPRVLWRDPQARMMVGILAIGTPLLIALLWRDQSVGDPIREGIFQFVSATSTTGWQTSDIGSWNDSAIMVVVWGAMFVGGATGATVGGIKLIRAYILFRAATWRIRRAFVPPEAIVPFRIGERVVPARDIQREIADAAVFTFLWLVILIAAVVVTGLFVGSEFTLADVLFEAMSVQSTTGLSAGITSPDMPVVVEITYIVQMWIGRLEIFPVIILVWALIARPWNRVKGVGERVRDRRRSR
jgi:trk system potassium uptake protein TrkH